MKNKKTIFFSLLSALALSMSSCTVTTPVTATSNAVGSKVGIAKSTGVLIFFPDGGDLSIRKAAKNGGISRISTVDFKKSLVFFNFVISYETIVTGE